VTAAADVHNADLEGKQAPDCKIVAGFFDAGTPAAELHNGRALDPGEVSCRRPDGAIVFDLAIWEVTIRNLADSPGELETKSSTWDLRVKGNTRGNIERRIVQLEAEGAYGGDVDGCLAAVPRSTSIRAIGNFEISQTDVRDAYSTDKLTFDDPIPSRRSTTVRMLSFEQSSLALAKKAGYALQLEDVLVCNVGLMQREEKGGGGLGRQSSHDQPIPMSYRLMVTATPTDCSHQHD
jgi:hypothetical protein